MRLLAFRKRLNYKDTERKVNTENFHGQEKDVNKYKEIYAAVQTRLKPGLQVARPLQYILRVC